MLGERKAGILPGLPLAFGHGYPVLVDEGMFFRNNLSEHLVSIRLSDSFQAERGPEGEALAMADLLADDRPAPRRVWP